MLCVFRLAFLIVFIRRIGPHLLVHHCLIVLAVKKKTGTEWESLIRRSIMMVLIVRCQCPLNPEPHFPLLPWKSIGPDSAMTTVIISVGAEHIDVAFRMSVIWEMEQSICFFLMGVL